MKGLRDDHWSLAGGLSQLFWVDLWSLVGLLWVFWVISAGIRKLNVGKRALLTCSGREDVGTILGMDCKRYWVGSWGS